jgi:type 1 glutamine amidotransferase
VLVADTPERVEVADASGAVKIVPRRNVSSIRPSTLSLMPEGIDTALGSEKLRDLLAFLLTRPLEPAALEAPNPPPPPPRPRAALRSVAGAREVAPAAAQPLRVLLVAGPKDHGPGEHDYPLWQKRWAKLLSLAENVTVATAMGWPKPEQFATADVAVFYSNNAGWVPERAAELDAFQQRGGGLVYLHYAVDGHRHVEALSERIGLAWRGGHSRFRHGALDLKFHDATHPVTRGFETVSFVDESYWNLIGDPARVRLLASGVEDGAARPLLWTREAGRGRVFVSILGHYTWTFDDPLFRLLVLRGMAWAAGQPADRLEELADVGARVQ